VPATPGQPPAVSNGISAKTPASVDLIYTDSLLVVSFQDLPTPVTPFEQKVHDDGTVILLLNQAFVATNKTCRQLEKEVRERYVPKLYKQMTVTVAISGGTRFYTVDGEVKMPNKQPWIGRTTLRQAIASCGDFTDFANRRKVRLTRADGSSQEINILKVIQGKSPDLEVFPGDKINVPRKWW
jgi:protein involved in polysaccharide export with SLBB domain